MREAVKAREAEYEKRRSDVDAELNRNIIAEHTAESANRSDVVYNVNITSTSDKLHSVGAHVSDFALLVQGKDMLKDIQEHKAAKERYLNAIYQRNEIADRLKAAKEKGEKTDKLEADYRDAVTKTDIYFNAMLRKREKLNSYNDLATDFYDTYQGCHDKNGKLVLDQVGKDGNKLSRMNDYIRFHVMVATDMSEIFDGFSNMYREKGEKIMDEEFISDRMKKDDWGQIYTGYKRFNLYSAIIQKEAETNEKASGVFSWIFSGDSPTAKTLKIETEKLEKSLKEAKKSQDVLSKKIAAEMKKYNNLMIQAGQTEDKDKKADLILKQKKSIDELQVLSEQNNIATVKITTLEKQVADYKAASKNLKELSSKDQTMVKKFRDYVRLVELSLARYGVGDDGKLLAKGLGDENMDIATENAYRVFEAVEKTRTQNNQQ